MSDAAPPKITVVTPCFNSARTIRETLDSVVRQNYPNLEHIVIDGGSTDATLDILREYPHLTWFSEKDDGLYHAMNKGIARATGEAVAILNSDDCYCDGILKAVGVALAAHPEWDALFGDVIYVDDQGGEIFRREEACWDAQIVLFGFGLGHHQALFIRKRTYDKLGLLRHKDFKGSCDYEFNVRMAHAKCRVGHIPNYVVRFRYHERGQSADKRVVANMARESLLIRQEYGIRGGLIGKLLGYYARIKRQVEKLVILGKCDLIPGTWHLKRHMRAKTEFTSNTQFPGSF